MENPLDEAIAILMEFEVALEQGRQLWIPKNADATFGHEWQKKYARCWIHGTTHILESNELERSKVDMLTLSPMAAGDARKYIRKWKKSLEDKNSYYDPAGGHFRFKMPQKNENLAEFIYKTAVRVEQNGFGAKLERRALKSFIGYLRQFGSEAAFLELIFPRKMYLHHGRIARKISNEAFAIPEETAASILAVLAKNCCTGRRMLGIMLVMSYCVQVALASVLRKYFIPRHTLALFRGVITHTQHSNFIWGCKHKNIAANGKISPCAILYPITPTTNNNPTKTQAHFNRDF
jgi:hypothetical protein